jgi:glucokinase
MPATAGKLKRATIGIDVGGTKVLTALFDEKFELLAEVKFKTRPEKDEKYFFQGLQGALNTLLKRIQKANLILIGAGIGCAGFIDRDKGIIKMSHNIPFLKNYPISSHVTKLLRVPVILGNDVQMGLYGEHKLGAAMGQAHVIGVFFGTGIGGALIFDHKLYLGADGCAGDIGHYLLSPLGLAVGSKPEGTLAGMVSRRAIASEAALLASEQDAPHLFKMAGTDVDKIRGGVLAKSIKGGDKKVEEVVCARARMAGIAISNMVDFLNPNMVVLGGGLVDALPTLFLKEVREGIRKHATAEAQKGLNITVSKLKDHVVTAGAARMAWDKK